MFFKQGSLVFEVSTLYQEQSQKATKKDAAIRDGAFKHKIIIPKNGGKSNGKN